MNHRGSSYPNSRRSPICRRTWLQSTLVQCRRPDSGLRSSEEQARNTANKDAFSLYKRSGIKREQIGLADVAERRVAVRRTAQTSREPDGGMGGGAGWSLRVRVVVEGAEEIKLICSREAFAGYRALQPPVRDGDGHPPRFLLNLEREGKRVQSSCVPSRRASCAQSLHLPDSNRSRDFFDGAFRLCQAIPTSILQSHEATGPWL